MANMTKTAPKMVMIRAMVKSQITISNVIQDARQAINRDSYSRQDSHH